MKIIAGIVLIIFILTFVTSACILSSRYDDKLDDELKNFCRQREQIINDEELDEVKKC